jgi:hypothetical protein
MLGMLSSRNEISYPLGGNPEPLTCNDANFGGFVVPFRLLGPNSTIQRVVPLPPAPSQNGIHFSQRRLTLSYDNLAGGPDPITVTGRFLPKSLSVPINVTIPAGQCHVVEIPPRALRCVIGGATTPAGYASSSPWRSHGAGGVQQLTCSSVSAVNLPNSTAALFQASAWLRG